MGELKQVSAQVRYYWKHRERILREKHEKYAADVEGHRARQNAVRAKDRSRYASYTRKSYRKHRERMAPRYRARTIADMRARRTRILAAYGNVCACCGLSDHEFLTLDHKNGGGTQHRLKSGLRGSMMYIWVERNGFPEDFRLLCYNCNCSIGHYGYCPHRRNDPAFQRPVKGGPRRDEK